MKKYILFFALLSISFVGISKEVSFKFNITETTNNNDGSIEARISGVYEGTEVSCIKESTGEEMHINELFFDPETEEFVAIVKELNEGDYLFRADYEGQTFEETVHLALATQTNPLAVSFTVLNQKGANLGQITSVITTGSIEPDVELLDVNGASHPFSSSTYNASNNTLTVIASNLQAGGYTLKVDDGTFHIEQSTTVLYEVVSLTLNFDVVHVLNNSDAQVTVEILGGTAGSVVTLKKHGDNTPVSFTSSFSLPTYQKTLVAQNLGEGVYEVHVSENGLDAYSYVWVGKYGESTTLCVQPDANYGIDACLRSLTRPGYSHLANTNYGTYSNALAFHGTHGGYPNRGKEVMKFHYHGLEKATIDNAKLELFGWHYRNQGYGGGYANEVFVNRILNGNSWDENTVTWNTQPIATNTNQGVISQYGGSTYANVQYTKEVTLTDLVKDQLNPVNENNGFLLELAKDYRYRSQYFYSSDHTQALKRPKLCITFTLPAQKQFVKVKRKLDGGFVTLEDRKLRFIYQEEYKNLNEKLTYNVYNDKHEVVMSDVLNTTLPASHKLDVTNIKYGQNPIVLNINCCLSCGEYFVLEVINEKNEKWYLRFKTDGNDGTSGGAVIQYPQGHPCSTVGS